MTPKPKNSRTAKHRTYANAAAVRLLPHLTMCQLTGRFTKAIIALGSTPTHKQVKNALLSIVREMEFNVLSLPEDDKPAKDIVQIEIDYPDRRKK